VPEDEYADAVIMQKKKLNAQSIGIITLIAIAIILFVLVEFFIYKKKKKRPVNSKNLLMPRSRKKK
jgi:preprotein translocase subunit YajC